MHNTLFGGDNLHLLILSLSAWFGLGAAFYVFRLVCSGYLKRVNGYFDRENEFWHGACMLGMVGCLTPWVLPWPALAWTAPLWCGCSLVHRACLYLRQKS
jgi:hypothetical protein